MNRRSGSTWLAVGLTFCCGVTAAAATINVPGDFTLIQGAINHATSGDTILVAPGAYHENLSFKGKAIIVRSTGGPEVTQINGGKNGSVVRFDSGEGPASVLKGFTIVNGSGTSPGMFEGEYGGGIYCLGTSPTITGNVITGNESGPGLIGLACGGGIYVKDGSPLIEDNVVTGNLAAAVFGCGGGIYTKNGSPVIRQNEVSSNTAGNGGGMGSDEGRGGGIYCTDGSVTVEGNLVRSNLVVGWDRLGGGIYCNGCQGVLANNVVIGNSAGTKAVRPPPPDPEYRGGGIYCNSFQSIAVINNTIWNNSLPPLFSGGSGIYGSVKGGITNNIVWANTGGPQLGVGSSEVTYCDVEGGYTGIGNISTTPGFVSTSNSDFHLLYSSPCRDTGSNAAAAHLSDDYELDPRIAGGTVDMGADEFFRHLYHTGLTTPGGNMELRVVGSPGSYPVILAVHLSLLPAPMEIGYGTWYLQLPLAAQISLWPVPADGYVVLPYSFPPTFPAPLDIHLQALVFDRVTNLDTLRIR